MTLPTIALFTGDPAGIGPELVEKFLHGDAWRAQAKIVLVGQRSALQTPNDIAWHPWAHQNHPPFARAQASEHNGRYMLHAMRECLQLVQSGAAQAFCFAPLNKQALRLGGMHQEDELRWFAEELQFVGTCGELNVLKNLWASRVTSHVALREVAELLTAEKVCEAIVMITRALQKSGITAPRVAVCGLNPHNGDNGNYGDEEARIITPGIAQAATQGVTAHGPFPADTAFVRALKAEQGYDGVVTMYHDQGQIAMKLMGFEQGVTVHGGLPFPITTPAHGTAYDIAGQGIANAQAMGNAFALAARMAGSQ